MMTEDNTRAASFPALRMRAEAALKSNSTDIEKLSSDELKRLFHELQVYQMELEIQNEELQRAQLELSQSRDRFVELYDFAPVGYLTLDEQSIILEANLTAAGMLGQTREYLINNPFTHFIAPGSQDDFYFLSQRIRDSKESGELKLSRKDGTLFPVQIELLRKKDFGNYLPVLHIVIIDITRLKQAETALLAKDKRKNEYLAMLAHELRNPLAPIRNAAAILNLLKIDDPNVIYAKKIIDRQVNHIALLVDDLLDISRIQQNKIILKKEPLDLCTLIQQTLRNGLWSKEYQLHRFELKLPENPAIVEADTVRLTQMVGNLIDNAVKFTPEGGDIEISLSITGSQSAEIKVADNGIGISDELLPYIFDMFQQGERNLARSEGGLGLGLTLVKHLATLHGGKIEAYSAGINKGSEFTISLPLIRPLQPAIESTPALESGSAQHFRILLVEDNIDVAESTALIFQLRGHQVKFALNGEEGLAVADVFQPQLILIDIGLPDMDGFEVARRIRVQQAESRKSVLVALTGYGTERIKDQAVQAGFDRFMTKPAPANDLLNLLDMLEIKPASPQ